MPSFRLLLTALALALLAAACGGAGVATDSDAPPEAADAADDDTDGANADDDVVTGDPAPTTDTDPDPAPNGDAPQTDSPTGTVPAGSGIDDGPAGGEAAPPVEPPRAQPPTAQPPTAEPPVLADGRHQGRLAEVTTSYVTLDLMRILSGEEALAAAEADGVDVSDGLPNDFYIADLGRTVTVPIAGDAGVRIIDCSAACEEAGTTLEALASGTATPFGGPSAPVEVIVDGGDVVSLAEIYLP